MIHSIASINCDPENVPAPLFYKCRMFCLYNDATNRLDYYENPYYKQPEGYETELVQWHKNKGVERVYALRFRPEVLEKLDEHNIKWVVLPDQESKIMAIIESIQKNINL